jgi:hypothetical protein
MKSTLVVKNTYEELQHPLASSRVRPTAVRYWVGVTIMKATLMNNKRMKGKRYARTVIDRRRPDRIQEKISGKG